MAAILLLALLAQDPTAGAREKGVAFLLSSQLENGAWVSKEYGLNSPGHKIAITAAVVHALLSGSATPEILAAARRGIGFIETSAKELEAPGNLNGFDFTPWAAAYGLSHLDGALRRWPAGEEPPKLDALAATLIEAVRLKQKKCGGWTYMALAPDGSVSFLTAAVVEGLLRWKERGAKVDPAMLDRALKDLAAMRKTVEKPERKDGFAYDHVGNYGNGPGKGFEGRSLQCSLTLLEAGRGQADLVEKYLDGFFRMRSEYVKARTKHEHTEPYWIAGYYYYSAHAYAARAIGRLGKDPQGHARTIRRALLEEQDADGSWYDAPCGHKTYGTAMALLTLAQLRELAAPWLGSLDLGQKAAAEDGTRMLLLVAEGGRDVLGIEKALSADDARDLLKRFTCVRLDLRAGDPQRRKLGLSGGSALMVLDAAGKVLHRWTSRRDWRETLEAALR